ncbi:hypothetical protein ACFPM0_16365 [Pseudonocardia sulfidoxydans]
MSRDLRPSSIRAFRPQRAVLRGAHDRGVVADARWLRPDRGRPSP